jgi:hypothetical protein
MSNLAPVPPPMEDAMPEALADVARALGEALAAQFRADNSQKPKGTKDIGIRKSASPAGNNQSENA